MTLCSKIQFIFSLLNWVEPFAIVIVMHYLKWDYYAYLLKIVIKLLLVIAMLIPDLDRQHPSFFNAFKLAFHKSNNRRTPSIVKIKVLLFSPIIKMILFYEVYLISVCKIRGVVYCVSTYEYDDPLFLKLVAPVPSSELCNFIVSINGDVWPKWVVFNLEELFYENATNLYIVFNFT